ncbi:Nucleoporin NDC1 isoform X1 [Oopsacas minuta]|uniref:Nucleoporin NDC1 isoform X1 n=1 Tax=Oopsacas minuta TaxID=111878 RepID=A0AAV7K132_9METZ|nr:Nucleoporin NDC1 isoform X1 [Oopsacas minuta]
MFEEYPFPPKPYLNEFVARSISTALWLCVLNFFLSVSYSTISCILNPTHLFSDWIIVSPHFISLLLQLNLFSCLFIVLFSCCYSLKYTLFPSRYTKIVYLFNRQSITFILIYATLSWATVVTWRRHDYSLISTPSDRLEELVYLFYGFSFGLSTAFSTISLQTNTLSFPIIQQPKLFRIQLELFSFSKRKIVHSLLRLWFSSTFVLLSLTALSPEWVTSYSSLSILLNVLNPLFLIKLNFIFALSLIQNTLCWRLFNISQTHAFRFPCAPSPFPSLLSLSEAVRTSSPLLTHLAFQDLSSLSLHSEQRRAALFSLDAHTGQGDNWSHVYHACTRLLNEFIAKLEGEITEISPDDSVTGSFYSPVRSSPQQPVTYKSASTGAYPPTPLRGLQDRAWDQAVAILVSVRQTLEQSFIARYFNEPLKLNIFFSAYADAGLYRWALVSLSELSTAAYQEDKYGLIQKNLPAIINQLLTLSNKLDGYKPPSALYSSQGATDYRVQELNTLRAGVIASLASCLHRISLSYRSHLYSIGLTSEQQLKLLSLSRDYFSE